MGNDRNGKKSSQSVLQEVLGGLQAAPLSAAARTKTNGAARLSSQAEKHHVRVVALARLFPPPTRRNRPESSQEPHTAVSQRRRLLRARSRRAAAVFTAAAAASYTATVAASVRPEGGRTQDLTFDLPVSSQMPLSRSSFPPSADTSCSRVRVSCPLLTPLPSPSPSRSPTPSPSPSLLLGISRPSTRSLACISVYQNPTRRRISGAQCKERDLPGASLFRVFTAA